MAGPVVILGAGGYAGVVRDCIGGSGHDLIGYLDDRPVEQTAVARCELLGRLDDLAVLARDHPGLSAVIAVGDNMTRRRIAQQAERQVPGLRWAMAIHPSAIISPGAQIGAGTVIVAGSIVNNGCQLGRHVLINSGSVIDHDNRFGDFSSTGPAVSTGGNVEIGALSYIGIGASVRHGIRIGGNSVIGAQSYVDRDVGDDLVCFGIPARVQYGRVPGQPYL